MVSKTIRQLRCEDVLRQLMIGRNLVSFVTLTTKDVVDYQEIRERWRRFRHYWAERFGTKYVMNYELHPNGHGWHIHFVSSDFFPLVKIRKKLIEFGFGRVDVQKVDSIFVADYLSKHCLKAYRGVRVNLDKTCRLRLVNSSRGFPRLDDYKIVSDFKTKVDNVFKLVDKRFDFYTRYRISELSVLLDKPWRWTLEKVLHTPLAM